jgi:hypothetical protein
VSTVFGGEIRVEKRLKLHQKWNMIEEAKISTFGGKHGVSTLH